MLSCSLSFLILQPNCQIREEESEWLKKELLLCSESINSIILFGQKKKKLAISVTGHPGVEYLESTETCQHCKKVKMLTEIIRGAELARSGARNAMSGQDCSLIHTGPTEEGDRD